LDRLVNGRVKQTVKAGVHAEHVKAKGREGLELRKMVRDMVEAGIVRLNEVHKKEHLTGDDVELLAKYARLLDAIEKQIPDENGLGTKTEAMTDEELAKAAGVKR
jgi:predicted transcriptional regulator